MFKRAFILGVLALPQLALAMGGSPMHSGGCHGDLNSGGCTNYRGPFVPQQPTVVTVWNNQPSGPVTVIGPDQIRQRQEQERLDQERRDRAERDARERAQREAEDENRRQAQARQDELRGYFATFMNRTEAHDRTSVRTFVNNAASHLLTYPENLPIAHRRFAAETRRFQKATIGGVIYIAEPSNVEVVNWLRDTAGFTAEQFAGLDNIRTQRRGGNVAACMIMSLPESSRERVIFSSEQCSAIEDFSDFVLTLQ